MFESLTNKLQGIFDQLGQRGKLTEADVDVALREVRLALLEADVNLAVTKDFIKLVYEELIATLGEPGKLNLMGPSPRVIMLVGLQGSGKTTTAAKLALRIRR